MHKRLSPDDAHKDLAAAAEGLSKKMSAIEEKIIQSKSKSSEDPLNYPIQVADQMMALGNTVNSADAAPTAVSYEVFHELNRRLDEQLAKWKSLKEGDLSAFNEMMQKSNIPLVMVTPVKHD